MSGKILVAEGIATNRIVLKVKLSAAFYRVVLAGSCTEVRGLMAREKPDIVLISDNLENCELPLFIRELHETPGFERVPIVALLHESSPEKRIRLLKAGAVEVIESPLVPSLLLARFRRLIRQSQDRSDLDLTVDKVQALGFSETPSVFAMPGKIAALTSKSCHLNNAFQKLAQTGEHRFSQTVISTDGGLENVSHKPDVVLVGIEESAEDDGLAHLAELGIVPNTRHARLIAVLEQSNSALAAKALDTGAHDVFDLGVSQEELVFRVNAELARKRVDDQLRNQLKSSVDAALRDPLTGLHNRRYGLSECRQIAQNAFENRQSFVVMVADLDHFKRVNDTYGHTAGDVVLTRVATQLGAALEDKDVLARIGGEEFLIVLPGAGRQDACRVADRLCRAVREAQISVPGAAEPIGVTISLGATVAEFPPSATLPSVENLLMQADQALYSSKSEGRDTVTFNQLTAA
ncbi:MAG: diguanylate cyclase [Pseudomonadota bacterium]